MKSFHCLEQQQRMSWQEQVLHKEAPNERGELCCIVVPDGTNCTELLARVYKDARKRGLKRVKILCKTDEEMKKFFETTLRKVDNEIDPELELFGAVDNKEILLPKADFLLFDKAMAADATALRVAVDAAAENKLTMVIVVQQTQVDALQAFGTKLRKRFVRVDSSK